MILSIEIDIGWLRLSDNELELELPVTDVVVIEGVHVVLRVQSRELVAKEPDSVFGTTVLGVKVKQRELGSKSFEHGRIHLLFYKQIVLGLCPNTFIRAEILKQEKEPQGRTSCLPLGSLLKRLMVS